MARIEKTVFISYRRTDIYTALAVYENLKNQGYDVFFDYRSISSGDFEQIISSNIKARAHFLLILTPTALDRCNEPGDWLRREIELAIDQKRNIIPLFFKGFRFGDPSVAEKLTSTLKNLSRYNGLNVHEDYFDEAMDRLSTQYLNIPLETVLHPVSTEVQQMVKEEQVAADQALKQIDDIQELVKHEETQEPQQISEQQIHAHVIESPVVRETHDEIPKKAPLQKSLESEEVTPKFNARFFGLIAGGIVLLALSMWAGKAILNNLKNNSMSATETSIPVASQTSQLIKNTIPATTGTSILLTSTPGIHSTMTGKDGMTLLYVPAGNFTMGSDKGKSDEQPVHTVYMDAFWIDKTEVTNKMYELCVLAGQCKEPSSINSHTHPEYYGKSDFDNYPVIYTDWNMANTYCEWANRRLPTEAEWEKAARGTNKRMYPWGDSNPNNNLLNYNKVIGDTTEVNNYSDGASPYGALNMAGNVWEWVSDWYDANYYNSSPPSNPRGQDSGRYHVLRGGSWAYGDNFVSTTYRGGNFPAYAPDTMGFRCAMSATQ